MDKKQCGIPRGGIVLVLCNRSYFWTEIEMLHKLSRLHVSAAAAHSLDKGLRLPSVVKMHERNSDWAAPWKPKLLCPCRESLMPVWCQ